MNAIVGWFQFGGTQLRGIPVAAALGCTYLNCHDHAIYDRIDTALAIKRHLPTNLRSMCNRFIYDPLDCWYTDSEKAPPAAYWRELYEQWHFDEIIATSPACVDQMQLGLSVPIHLLPHHADPRIVQARQTEIWYNSQGPVVYAGDAAYLGSDASMLVKALHRLQRRLQIDNHWEALRGAALAIAVRRPPSNTMLNLCCKPQIKLENAIAAGVPMAADVQPALRSLAPTIALLDFRSVETLTDSLDTALQTPPLIRPAITLSDHVQRVRDLFALPELAH